MVNRVRAYMHEGEHLFEQGIEQLRVAAGEARHLHLVQSCQEAAPEGLRRPLS